MERDNLSFCMCYSDHWRKKEEYCISGVSLKCQALHFHSCIDAPAKSEASTVKEYLQQKSGDVTAVFKITPFTNW